MKLRGVESRWADLGGVPGEWLVPEQASEGRTILYLHGGGWVLGYYSPHRLMVGRIARAAQARALVLDYRLAPEHPFPAALEDSLAAYRCLLQQGVEPGKLVLAGDSAGGNLVPATLLALRDAGDPLPAGAALLSPATDLTQQGSSFETNLDKEALLPKSFVDSCLEMYLNGADPCQPLVSPLFGDLHGLPPLLIQAGGDELLLSDSTRFAEKAQKSGVQVKLEVYPGMWHVWQMYAPFLPEGRQAVNSIAAFIRDVTA